ncbi:MAG: preprotein translocase subunit SecY [Candidatus Pacebacteria bacterium]|nr:preprotein translocase subunit SecY [Candidatus Paceibacterota bacterium]
MFKKLIRVFKDRELRNKIFYVAVMLIIFRIAAHIPIPIVDSQRLNDFFNSNQLLGLLSAFTGGGMENFSLVMLGIGPYITASIIMQLLTMIFPQVKELYQESGEAGRQKFNQYTRYATVPLAMLQGFAMITLLKSQGIISNIDKFDLIVAVSLITAGTIFLMWIGELISEKKIGNGISLIIFAGIVSGLPRTTQQVLTEIDVSPDKIPSIVALLVLAVIVILGVVFITEAQRNIPVSYARRVRGSKTYGGVSTFLPLKVNSAGMIPLIFAMSMMLFPGIIASFFVASSNEFVKNAAVFISNALQPGNLIYGVLYFILVFLFTYFYTSIVFDPNNVADNLQKHGGFVPGIRPGKNTAEFLGRVLGRITFLGAFFLGLIAVLPFIGQAITNVSNMAIGGASVLIVVGVVLESIRQIDSQLTMRDYDEL